MINPAIVERTLLVRLANAHSVNNLHATVRFHRPVPLSHQYWPPQSLYLGHVLPNFSTTIDENQRIYNRYYRTCMVVRVLPRRFIPVPTHPSGMDAFHY